MKQIDDFLLSLKDEQMILVIEKLIQAKIKEATIPLEKKIESLEKEVTTLKATSSINETELSSIKTSAGLQPPVWPSFKEKLGNPYLPAVHVELAAVDRRSAISSSPDYNLLMTSTIKICSLRCAKNICR